MKERIGIITGGLIVGLLLAWIGLIGFKIVFIIIGSIMAYEGYCLMSSNYKFMRDKLKAKYVKRWHGKDFTASICGQEIKGKVSTQTLKHNTNFVYLCFDVNIVGAEDSHDYAELEDTQGFRHAWFIGFGDKDSLNMASVENLIIKGI